MERQTRQRDAIWQAFESSGRPLSAHEAHELATGGVAGLGIATVYRNIKAFVEEGWLDVVELPGEPPRYEVTGKDHHHHFRCTACHRVYDVPGCPSAIQSLVPTGFRLEGHDVLLTGVCAGCVTTP